MKRFLFSILMVAAMNCSMGQADSTALPALPGDKTVAISHYSSDKISDELEQIQQTFRSWRRHAPSHEAFYQMINRLEYLIANNPRDRGVAYMRMGQMYRTIEDPKLRNLSKAIECYTKAIPNLTHPDDASLLGLTMIFLGRCYLQEGEMQDVYQAVKYLGQSFAAEKNQGVEYAQMFLFGWGVPQDLYLSACIYDLHQHSDNRTDLNQLYNIRYLLEHADRVSDDGRKAWEDYIYTGDVRNRPWDLKKAGTRAAKGGVPEAMREMGLGWADGNFGGSTQQRRKEAFQWLRQCADAPYVSGVYALALFCQQNIIDTALGDIYKPNPNGRYNQEDIIKVNRQCMALLRRAAEQGDGLAQRTLGEWYINDDLKEGIGTNYPQAAYWLNVAAYNGDRISAKILDNIRPMLDKAKKKMGDEAYQQLMNDAMLKADETQYGWAMTMQRIKRHAEFNKPKTKASMLPMQAPTPEMLDDMAAAGFKPHEAADYLIAIGYKQVYDKYEQVVMELNRDKNNPFNTNSKQYFQTQMSQLRRRAEQMPHCLITQVSPMEIQ